MEKEYNFKVNTIEAGQRRKYGDSYYTYEIISSQPPYIVKNFCTKVLRPSVPKEEMSDPFDSKLIKFECTSEEVTNMFLPTKERTYIYKTTSLYTG